MRLEGSKLTEASLLAEGVDTLAGRKSRRMANITATLPIQLLDKIDEMVDEDKVPSRSFVIREAVRKYLKEFERK